MKIETYKSNSIIGSGINIIDETTGKITLQDERYINVCLGRIYKKELLDKDIWYGIDVNDYAETTGIARHEAYKELREIASSLREAKVIIPQGKGVFIEVGWINAILYNQEDCSVAVQWNELVIPFISGFKYGNFTIIEESASHLRSINSYRLYEIVKRESYKKVFTIDYEDLKKMLFLEYKLFGDFNAKLLRPCMKEINLKTNLEFDFIPVKVGRKVVGIEFRVKV